MNKKIKSMINVFENAFENAYKRASALTLGYEDISDLIKMKLSGKICPDFLRGNNFPWRYFFYSITENLMYEDGPEFLVIPDVTQQHPSSFHSIIARVTRTKTGKFRIELLRVEFGNITVTDVTLSRENIEN